MKYRKKPLEVEAIQWTGDLKALVNWAKSRSYRFEHKKGWFGKNVLYITTNKGSMKAFLGDYIIKGIKGEFYPVSATIFKDTYERIA